MQFGLYLVENGIITPEQFVEALQVQIDSRPQLGSLAIEQKALTMKEVFQVLRTQADEPKELFGQLAVEAGLISEDRLASLLYLQSARVRSMEEIVVELGYVSAETLEQELSEYRYSKNNARETQPVLGT